MTGYDLATRYCVVGAGAVGGSLTAALASAGRRVSVLIRPGEHGAALRERGLVVRDGSGERAYAVDVHTRPEQVGPVDTVIVCVKAQDLPDLPVALAPLTGDAQQIIVVMNGVPWWLPAVAPEPPDDPALRSVDPDGALLRDWPADRVIAGVAHFSASVPQPGVVARGRGNLLLLGAPDGRAGPVPSAVEDLTAGGVDARWRSRIVEDVWVKLLGNLNINPLSALTGATVDVIIGNPAVRRLAVRMIDEGVAVGRALGIEVDVDADQRLDMTLELGAFRTSMLQDLDRGRPLELDALTGAVAELGGRLRVPTPNIDAVLGLLQVRMGLPGPIGASAAPTGPSSHVSRTWS